MHAWRIYIKLTFDILTSVSLPSCDHATVQEMIESW